MFASIVPPLFRGGYHNGIGLGGGGLHRLQSCRPHSGAVIGCRAAPHARRLASFNRAAPIPGRLFVGRNPGGSVVGRLQSCRPYYGAVIGYGREHQGLDGPASIVPPLFRGGYPSVKVAIASSANSLQLCRPHSGAVIRRRPAEGMRQTADFNRAAPIQGRLSVEDLAISLPGHLFQLCRPYSGAVIPVVVRAGVGSILTSIVPPLFRGGYYPKGYAPTGGEKASIVPPLFRGGYLPLGSHLIPRYIASIVPPLFRGGYGKHLSSDRVIMHASIVPRCATAPPSR